jgi:formylglycine-generating enzyme required for sulfatase activity
MISRNQFRALALSLLGVITSAWAQSNGPSLLPPTSGLAHPTSRLTLLTPRLPSQGLVLIPAGSYLPLNRSPKDLEKIPVAAFWLAEAPVTNAQYLEFVRAHPKWQRSQVSRLVADSSYLAHWAGDLELGPAAPPAAPVVRVSWFAARAYAAALGQRLPTTAEWEQAAAAGYASADGRAEAELNRDLYAWLGRPTPAVLPDVATARANFFGVRGLHGLVWEWVEDFNPAPVTGESRRDADRERDLFSGADGAKGAIDSAAYLRQALRASLKATTTTSSLGFRCAQDQVAAP